TKIGDGLACIEVQPELAENDPCPSLIGMRSYQQVRRILSKGTQELTVLDTLLCGQPAGTSTRQQRFCIGYGGWRALRRANMSEDGKERSPQQLAKSRRDYLVQVKMLTVDERTQEAAKINKALGIKAREGTTAAATLCFKF